MAIYNISSGVTSTGITLNTSDYMYVMASGRANSTTVKAGGFIVVSSAGSASVGTVSSGGKAWVYSGGKADSFTVLNGAEMNVSGSKATAHTAKVSSGGILWVSSAGVVSSSFIYNGGAMYVRNYGFASGIEVSSGGTFAVYADGSASGVSAFFGGSVIVSSGGITSNAYLFGGELDVMSYGWANQTFVSRGNVNIHSGGIADNLFIRIDGVANVFNGGVASGVEISSGVFNVSSGGTAGKVVAGRDGQVNVVSGGFVSSANIRADGIINVSGKAQVVTLDLGNLYVAPGGSAANVSVWGGSAFVSSGGTLNNPFMHLGLIDVSSGATVNGANVVDGMMKVDGTANSTTVTSDGNLYVAGTAFNTVMSEGRLYVSGGKATSNFVRAAASMVVELGGVASETSAFGGASINLKSGGTASHTDLDIGYMTVSSGARANATFVSSGASLTVDKGGFVSKTHVYEDGVIVVSSGGVAMDTLVSGGMLYVSSGASAYQVTVSSGGSVRVNGGNAAAISLHKGSMFVSANGTATDVTAKLSASISAWDGGTVIGAVLSGLSGDPEHGGGLFLSNGGLAVSTTVDESGRLFVRSGGVARGVFQYSGGRVVIASGGTLTGNIDVESATVSSGGVVDFDLSMLDSPNKQSFIRDLSAITGTPTFTLTVGSAQTLGTFQLASKAGGFDKVITVKDTTGADLGTLTVNADPQKVGSWTYSLNLSTTGTLTLTVARDIFTGDLINESKDIMFGELASGVNIYSSGILTIASDGSADKTTVHSGGVLNVLSAAVTSTIVSSGGRMTVSNGGVASDTRIRKGGSAEVMYGGKVTSTTVDGEMDVYSGASITSTWVAGSLSLAGSGYDVRISSGGYVRVHGGGVADTTTMINGGTMVVEGPGSAVNVSMYGGSLYISSGSVFGLHMDGGTVQNDFLVSGGTVGGGTMQVGSYGSAMDLLVTGGEVNLGEHGRFNGTVTGSGVLRVGSAAELYNTVVESGGKVTGMIQVNRGGLTFGAGGILDFDISNVAPGGDVLVSNYSLISGVPVCTITVSATQANGTYKLASGADGLEGSVISVMDETGTKLGSLTVGGSATIGSTNYALTLNDSILSVTVEGIAIFTGDLTSDTKEINSSLHASRVNVNVEGILNIVSGGVASVTVINSDGRVNMSGGKAYDTVINSGGVMSVSYRGTASGVTVSSGGVLSAEDCYLIDAIVSGGTFSLSRGGSANNTRVSGSGSMYIDRGSALALSVFNKGFICVSSGGTASDIWVVGRMDVLAGAKVSGANVSSGKLYISSGASMVDVTVMKDGEFYLDSRTNVSSVTIQTGGSMTVGIGARVMSATMTGGVMDIKASAYVDKAVLGGGTILVSSGAFLNYAQLSSGVTVTVSEGGKASGASVGAGARVVFISGATGATIMENGGYVDVQDGATVQFSAHSFSATLTDEATAHMNTRMSAGYISSGGLLHVFSRGEAGSVTVLDGGAIRISSGGSARGVRLSGGELAVFAGGSADRISAFANGTVTLYSGAIVSDLQFSSGGILNVFGATVDDSRTRLYELRSACIKDGGVLANAEFRRSATIDVSSGGTLTSAKLESYMNLNVFNGGIVKNATIDGPRTVVTVESGGTASDISLKTYSGGMIVRGFATGVSAASTEIGVESGGIVSNATVTSSAFITVSSGGNAYNTEVNFYGSMTVLKGGTAVGVNVNSNNGILTAEGEVHDAVLFGGSMTVVGSGALAVYTSVGSRARMIVSSGAMATDTTVETDGNAYIVSGGVARGVNVLSGGRINATSGGKLTGSMYFSDSGSAYISSEGIVDFDLTGATPVSPSADEPDPTVGTGGPAGAIAILNDFTAIKGAPNFTLTVFDGVANGEYILANNAASFTGTLSVCDTSGAAYGELGVDGTVTVNSKSYTLNLAEAVTGTDLVVTVSDGSGPTPPAPRKFVAKSDIDGNGISDVMFVWTGEHGEGNYQQGYWMNGTARWQSANSPHPAEWENLGCHDMTGNGNADSVLVGNVVTEIGGKGAYIGYYLDADDKPDGTTWRNIGYLNNEEDIVWQNRVGNLTGDKNVIVWYAPELYALGIWVGPDEYPEWIALSASFGGNDWNLVGCGDFDGDGKDSVVMSYNDGQFYYTAGLEQDTQSLGVSDWRGWALRAIGDFSGDGKDDIVFFHEETGSMVLCADGNIDRYVSIGQLAADDWFVVGAGDYNGDQKDDLLVRQYSTGMLGFYSAGDTTQWVEMGRGVGMEWTVIA